jgi:hypothetical protein
VIEGASFPHSDLGLRIQRILAQAGLGELEGVRTTGGVGAGDPYVIEVAAGVIRLVPRGGRASPPEWRRRG